MHIGNAIDAILKSRKWQALKLQVRVIRDAPQSTNPAFCAGVKSSVESAD